MGLATSWPQSNETLTKQCGSLRGMHWQSEPHGEAKIVRCLHGSVLDVVVDVRAESKTFGEFQSFELSGANLNQLYIPKGFAHGYQTLEDNCIIHYQMSAAYHAPSATGFRWNDPFVGISWPLQVKNVSERDANLPFLGDLGLR
jgi:dTDP-4-dehydrorhamnose 3,5-epimerase